MASNRTVIYVDLCLNSVEDFWAQIVVPQVRAFESVASAQTAFPVATSVWHLNEWVWHEDHPGQEASGVDYQGFRSELYEDCPQLGWLRDITDAGKHRGLNRVPEVLEARPRRVGSSSLLLLGVGGSGKLVFTLVLSDGSHEPFDAVLRAAVEHWRKRLANRHLESPY